MAEIDTQFTEIMIGTAARDSRIHEVMVSLLFDSECRTYEAELTADVAEYYNLDPDSMQRVFDTYEELVG